MYKVSTNLTVMKKQLAQDKHYYNVNTLMYDVLRMSLFIHLDLQVST